ncbi:MAG: hypothetical protein ACO1NW_15470 [Chitinophagaceae bacterium]
MKKIILIFIALVVVVVGGIIYWRYYRVFGEGVKTGVLNYMVRKGDVFKTYEGKLIQEGIRSRTPGAVQSYEFDFSVTDPKLARLLMANSGKEFDLHYKEYHAAVPWRGFSVFIVDSIVAMRTLNK